MNETIEADTVPTATAVRSHLLGEPSGELVFKIRGGEHHGRVVRLRSLKCTIGSSADCTLRLCAPGVRAMHCLVIRGEAGAVVRRWSPDTQLNGHTFDDALLKVGDRLRVGPVELELLDAESPDPSPLATNFPTLKLPTNIPASAAIPPAPTAALVEEITARLRGKMERSKYRRLRISTRKKLAAAKARILRLKKQIRRVEKSLQGSDAERLQFQASLVSAQRAHEDAEKRVQATNAELQARLELLTKTQQDLQSVQQSLRERNETWSLEKSELEQAVASKQEALSRLEAEAHNNISAFEQQQIELRIAQQTRDQHELQTLQTSLTESITAQERLQLELQAAIQLHQQAARDLSELRQREQAANESLELLVQDEQVSRQTVQTLRQKIEELEFALLAETTEKETSTQQLQNELAATQANCDSWQARVNELQAAMSAAENSSVAQANLELQAAQLKLSAAQASLQQQQQEIEGLRVQLQQQAVQLKQSQADDKAARLACSNITSELVCLQQQIEHDAECLALQRNRIAELERLDKEWQEKFQALQLEELTHQADASLENAQLREALGMAQLHLQDATQQHAAELARTAAEISQLRETLSNRERVFDEQNNAAAAKIQTLESRIEELSQAALAAINTTSLREREFSEQASSAANKIDSLEKRIEDLLQTANAAREQLANEKLAFEQAWQVKLDAALKERNALQNSIAELTEQLSTQRGIADAHVEQRDAMLAQIREEVREQMRSWEAEKAELLAKLEKASALSDTVTNTTEPEEEVSTREANDHEQVDNQIEERYPSFSQSYPDFNRESYPNDNGYIAPLPASHQAISENMAEASAFASKSSSAVASYEDEALNAVLARLGAAGILKGNASRSERDEASPLDTPAESTEIDCASTATVASNICDTEIIAAEENEATEVSLAAHVTTSTAEANAEVVAATDSQGEEDSIEDYMNKLLRRVRGDSVANAFTIQPQSTTNVWPATKPSPSQSPESTVHEPLPATEYVPRTQPPEMNVDLSALRELAVSSAHQAIDLSRIRGHKQRAIGKMFAAICAFVCGNVLLYYGQQYGMRWAAFAAIAAFGLGTHWVIQRLKMMRAPRHLPTKTSGPQLPPRKKMPETRTTIVESDIESTDVE